ncbi:zinc finger protein 595-like isoform X2 [Leptopilina heterotoma]|uniref:zinc finger protein 595-like isoform X2 n=1 Tax=Leptopilina heterotoma TaxID=63436 RepID=UPI001CA82F04|nr:zinc finger protein 595-like isoform X2 [Leptopilina heterotoma]
MSSLDYLDLCRLCLVKDRVGISIFEDDGDVRQVFLKIASCLPVKVSREDKLPKKICDDCMYKLELFYQFWNTTANAEKQLLQWLDDVDMQDKQGYVTEVLNSSIMKQEQQASENRLDESVMQVSHQNNMGMGMMDNMGLGMPIIISTTNQPMTSVPMDTSGSSVQTIQAVPGTSTQSTHDQISQNQSANVGHHEVDEDSDEDEENESDDECDADDGLPVKEENEEDPNNRTVEPTTFVNVSLPCDEAGPSGLQQQKITEMPEMAMPQVASADNKTGGNPKGIAENKTVRLQNIIILHGNYFHPMPNSGPPVKILENVNKIIPNIKLPNNQCSTNKSQNPTFKIVPTLVPIDVNWLASSAKKNQSKKVPRNNEGKATTPKSELTCNVCLKKFSCKQTLKTHFIRKHTDNYKFSCKECGKEFKIWGELRNHMKKQHKRDETDLKEGISSSENKKRVRHKETNDSLSTESEMFSLVSQNNSENEISQKDPLAITQNETDLNNSQPIVDKNKFICKICSKTFSWKSTWKSHFIRMHTDNYEFSCEECGKQYKLWGDLRHHIRVQHKNPNEPDPQSGVPTRNRKRVRHKKIDPLSTESTMFCKNCNTSFQNIIEFHKHIDSVHVKIKVAQDGNNYSCEFCGTSYKNKNHLNNHLRQRHNVVLNREAERTIEIPEVNKISEIENKQNSKEKFYCETCGQVFEKKRQCIKHMQLIHLSTEMACNECGKQFDKRTKLIKHIQRHEYRRKHGPKKPQECTCEICGLTVRCRATLNVHHLRKHSQEFNFPCKHCSKIFKVRGDLTTHTRLNHKEPPAICEVCGKVTKNKHSLYIHQKYNHFRTAFICPICNKCYASQENLDQHVNEYHAKKERIFCDICKNSFMNKGSLRNHIAIVHCEKTFACETCGKLFSSSYRLKHHLLTHTNLRPYICNICGKQFKQKLSLLSHIKCHPEEHPPIPTLDVDQLLKTRK